MKNLEIKMLRKEITEIIVERIKNSPGRSPTASPTAKNSKVGAIQS